MATETHEVKTAKSPEEVANLIQDWTEEELDKRLPKHKDIPEGFAERMGRALKHVMHIAFDIAKENPPDGSNTIKKKGPEDRE